MEFILTYDGPLPSVGRPDAKQRIRRALHPQLQTLWNEHPAFERREYLLDPAHESSVIYKSRGFTFAPLICTRLKLLAVLDVLVLRPGRPGAVLQSRGDLDNQMKTLLDALRPPLSAAELPVGDVPRSDEEPFFCLTDDDKRIVDLRVRGEQLLQRSDPPSVGDPARVLIRVGIKAEVLDSQNMAFV